MKLIVFIIGLCIGSFINVVAYRLPRNMDYIFGRSMCPVCSHMLSFIDLIPILSYILLKGKCRYCHSLISIRYSLIELFSGFIFLLFYTLYGFSFVFLVYSILSVILLIISLIDLDFMIIPDELIVLCLCLIILFIYINNVSCIERIIGFFIISLPMYLSNLVKECFGGGDIKLISILGLLLGYKDLLDIMYIAFLFGGLYSILIIVLNNKDKYIPFGPFIFLGVFFVLCLNVNISHYFFA